MKIIYILFFSFLISNEEVLSFNDKWESGYYNNSWNSNDKNVYSNDSLLISALNLIQENSLKEAITILKNIISDSKSKLLQLNAHYSLAQIYLSHMGQYELAVDEFNQCLLYNSYENSEDNDSDIVKSFLELKQKATFMIAYTYHNHIGNYSKAALFYQNFIMLYPDHELVPSVKFELKILNDYEKVGDELRRK